MKHPDFSSLRVRLLLLVILFVDREFWIKELKNRVVELEKQRG